MTRYNLKGFSVKEWLKGIFAIIKVGEFVKKNAEALKWVAAVLVSQTTGLAWYYQIIAGLASKGILDVVHYYVSA